MLDMADNSTEEPESRMADVLEDFMDEGGFQFQGWIITEILEKLAGWDIKKQKMSENSTRPLSRSISATLVSLFLILPWPLTIFYESQHSPSGMVNDSGARCPLALQLVAAQLLLEVTAFLRETFRTIPRSRMANGKVSGYIKYFYQPL